MEMTRKQKRFWKFRRTTESTTATSKKGQRIKEGWRIAQEQGRKNEGGFLPGERRVAAELPRILKTV